MVTANTNVQHEMIKEFQCPGCMGGPDPSSCEQFHLWDNGFSFRCNSHVPGTTVVYPGIGSRKIALGLPKGFDKGFEKDTEILMYENPESVDFDFNHLNIPVWAFEENGYLFIRIYQPRINVGKIAIVKGGIREKMCPEAKDVALFQDQID